MLKDGKSDVYLKEIRFGARIDNYLNCKMLISI